MKKFIFFSIIFLIILIGYTIYLTSRVSKSTPKPVVTPTPFPSSFNSLPDKFTWTPDRQEKERRSYLVGKLINILPRETVLFTLSYDIDKDLFALLLKKNSVDDANKSFDLFLKENGVDSRLWIENLTVAYK